MIVLIIIIYPKWQCYQCNIECNVCKNKNIRSNRWGNLFDPMQKLEEHKSGPQRSIQVQYRTPGLSLNSISSWREDTGLNGQSLWSLGVLTDVCYLLTSKLTPLTFLCIYLKESSFSPALVSVVLGVGGELTPYKSSPECIRKTCVTGNL